MSAGVLVSLHGAGAGDMGRVAALAPGTRLLCTDQAALPLGLGLASLATLPPLLLAAGSLARTFRSQGGRCNHELGPSQECCSGPGDLATPRTAAVRARVPPHSRQVSTLLYTSVVTKVTRVSRCGPQPSSHVALSPRVSGLQTLGTCVASGAALLLLPGPGLQLPGLLLAALTLASAGLSSLAIAVFSQCGNNVKTVFRATDLAVTETKLSRLI